MIEESFYTPAELELKERLKSVDLGAIIQNELSQNKKFSLFENSPEVLIFFNHGERGQTRIHTGFPFPLISSSYDSGLNHLKLDFFIRGEPVRKIQRQMLKERASAYQEVNSGFSKIFHSMAKPKDRIIFLDPYHFIGDSFIGLHFLDSFSQALKIPNSVVFSQQYQHLSGVVNAKNYNPSQVAKEVKEGDLIVAPDLIDTHWNKTLSTLTELKGKKFHMAIPGRGLMLDSNGEGLRVYHHNIEDILLRNKNVEDYMNECLNGFGISGNPVSEDRKFNDTFRFFLNPFASEEARYIPPELMFSVYKSLKEKDKRSEFCLVSDYHHNPAHIIWLNKFLELMRADGSMRRVSINYYANLDELASHMQERECGSVLTADTSVAHVANRLGYPCVTTYNPIWWDSKSLQSMSGSSPSGFCRYFNTQIPVINNSYTPTEIKDTSELVQKAMIFSQMTSSNQRRIYLSGGAKWVDTLYDLDDLTKDIVENPDGAHLVMAAKKVSLKYKLENIK